MPTIVHFEIPSDNPGRAQKFYASVFGWSFTAYPAFDYWGVGTKDLKGKKGLGGGLMRRKDPRQPFMNYIHVDSIDAYMKKVQKAGGTVAMPKTPIGDMGWIAAFKDTENNLLGLHEMAPPKKTTKKGARKRAAKR
jgi:predicted enzyme related to lactoylglutathione lyase